MHTVSAVIPCYNGADFLPAAIESVLAQTLPANEIIVVDDGSGDSTSEIAASYPGVIVHRVQNGGVSRARNAGAQLATSEWIAFLDHDDLWLPTKLAEQMAALEKSPGCDVCVCDRVHYLQDQSGAWIDEAITTLLCRAERIPAELRRELRFNPSATVVRRSTLLSAGGFDPAAQPCEDWDMWLRLAKTARFCVVHRRLIQYRVHGSNTSRNAYRMMDAELRAWNRHIAPSVPAWTRPFRRRAARSRFLASVALTKRDYHEPHLGIMARSLALWPMGGWRRHKNFLHMLLGSVGIL